MVDVVFYHDDMDGIAAASVMLERAQYYIINGHANVHYPVQVPVDYHKYTDDEVKQLAEGKEVAVVDFSFHRELMEWLRDNTKILIWIDHHRTAEESMEDLWYSEIEGLRSRAMSGCVLTWKWMFKKPHYLSGYRMPLVLEHINDWDLWEHSLEGTKEIHEYLTMKFDKPSLDLLRVNIEEVEEKGKIALEAKQREVEKLYEQGNETTFEDHKAFAVNTNSFASDMGDHINKQGYDIAIMYGVKNCKLIVSLRSKTIDVGKIAEKYGGGGHPGAAGFPADLDMLGKFVSRR